MYMKSWKSIVNPILVGLLLLSCKKERSIRNDAYTIFDTNSPGLEPKIFSENRLSKNDRFEQYGSFSPDGKEYYFSYTDSMWSKSTIVRVTADDPEIEEELHLTESDYQSGQFIDRSGMRFFFTSLLYSDGLWHTEIFVSARNGYSWGKPLLMSHLVNSYICEWHPTLTDKGTMYFASERGYDHGTADIYKSEAHGNDFEKAGKLTTTINSEYNETDPLIAPDESYLIFASNRPGGVSGPDIYNRPNGYAELDLYISFNSEEGDWSEPKNMGSAINTTSWEFAPALSPDKRFLLFTRREAFNTLNPSKIYWVDSKLIDLLKEK
jgi:Tol biopolymer transport system component